MQVNSGQISGIAHATEDPEKVLQALDKVCPRDTYHPKIEKSALKGHHNNSITTITMIFRGRQAEAFFQRLCKMLSDLDRQQLVQDIDRRVDQEDRLHLRLDKQEAFRGKFRLEERDPIKIQVSFRSLSGSASSMREQIVHVIDPSRTAE